MLLNLYKYDSFEELFKKVGLERIGFDDGVDASIMDNFYSKEEQDKYQALGIEMTLFTGK